MTSIDQESPMLPKRAEDLRKEWKKMHDRFYANTSKEHKEFKERESFLLRLRRAISWLDGAQQVERGVVGEDKSLSAKFIFLWISFNVLYNRNLNKRPAGKSSNDYQIEIQQKYLDDILTVKDVRYRIKNLFNNDISSSIRSLTKNRFLRRQFIRRGEIRNPGRKPDRLPKTIIRERRTKRALHDVFKCLYILRNQMIHGHSTWCSTVAESQRIVGVKIMHHLLPIFIDVEREESFLMRANSWFDRAEKGLEGIDKDMHTQFIFLWVGFNAIYAGDPNKNLGQKEETETYFQNLLDCNQAKDTIYNVINSNSLKEKIESLGKDMSLSKDFLDKEKVIPFPIWNIESTENILCCIFQRLRDLRNQLVHGAESSDCKLNKNRLVDKTEVMHHFLPVFIEIMLKIPEKEWKEWGKIKFPRVCDVPIEGPPWEKRKF